ncbi:MAG: hypothetical protein V4737_02900 [Curtobacterium sp.]
MTQRPLTAVALGILSLLTLAACAGGPSMEQSPSSTPVSRGQAEQRSAGVQHRIVEAFPDGSVTRADDRKWVLLSCSNSEVQAAGGVAVTLAAPVDVEQTYDSITRAVEHDGYKGTIDTTPKGAKRLTITGQDNDQYLVTIYVEDKDVRISSFSQCFPGSLSDS